MTTVDERDFVHLHVQTEFSIYSGVARIKELVARAKDLGMKHLAITDYGALYGVIPFYKECKEQGIKPIIGCEVYVAPASRHDRWAVEGKKYYNLILLAENQTGYKNLVKLVSLANIEGRYYKPRVDKDLLRKYHEGIICLSSGADGEVYHAIIQNNKPKAKKVIQEYIEIFGPENYFIEIQNHRLGKEKNANDGLIELAETYGLGLVVTNNCRYICREDSELYAVLQCIEHDMDFEEYKNGGYDNGEYYLKSPQEMAILFPEYPDAAANTVKIAERCQVDFIFGQRHMPAFDSANNQQEDNRDLGIDYLKERYGYDSVAQIITFGTLTAKGAFREVGRVLGMDYEQVDAVARTIPNELRMTLDEALNASIEFRQYYESSEDIKRWVDLAHGLEHLPRHASTHASMVVVAPNPLMDYLPVSETEGSLVAEFPVKYLDELGMFMVRLTELGDGNK